MSRQNKRAWIAIAVVVALLVLAVAVNRATTKHGTAAVTASASSIAKAGLPDCPTATGDGEVHDGLPPLTLPCLGNGPKVDLSRLRGPLVVNIWAGPCAPCQTEAPLIQEFYAAAAGKVGVLGVVDGAYPDDPDDALDAAHGLGLHYPSLFDQHGKLATLVRTTGIPTTLFVRSDGTLAYTKIGQLQKGELSEKTRQYLGVEVDVPS